jgi:hypothetical protein
MIEGISLLELVAFPDIFRKEKPLLPTDTYRNYRNTLIAYAHHTPNHYITITQSRLLCPKLDLRILIRLHSFLEHWDLINANLTEDVNGILSLSLKMEHSSLRHTHCYVCQQLLHQMMFLCTSADPHFLICAECYYRGSYPSHFTCTDFVKSCKSGNDRWAVEEVLMLFEGIELYGEEWEDIACHVGTKTKEQCLLYFTRLPLEYICGLSQSTEEHFDQIVLRDLGIGDSEMSETKFSFSDCILSTSTNPLMSLLLFLGYVVKTNVAAAAAKGAIECHMNLKKEMDQTNGSNNVFHQTTSNHHTPGNHTLGNHTPNHLTNHPISSNPTPNHLTNHPTPGNLTPGNLTPSNLTTGNLTPGNLTPHENPPNQTSKQIPYNTITNRSLQYIKTEPKLDMKVADRRGIASPLFTPKQMEEICTAALTAAIRRAKVNYI